MKFSLVLIFLFSFSVSLFSETKKDFYIGEYVGDPVKSTKLYKEYKKKKGIEVTEERLKKIESVVSQRKLKVTANEIIIDNSARREHFSYKILQEEEDSIVFQISLTKTFYYSNSSTSTKNSYGKPIKFKIIFSDDKKSSVTHEYNDQKDYMVYKRK